MNTVYFNTPGAPLAAPGWKPIGMISADGIQLPPAPPQRGTPYYQELTKQITYTLTANKRGRRAMMNALGVYRLPDDKPLLHNGGKPR